MITLTINGKAQRYDGDPDMPLLWVLRDELDLKQIPHEPRTARAKRD